MNEYDSARMGDLLRESHGLERTENAEEADVLLLNTCSYQKKRRKKYSTNWDAGNPSKQNALML